jgi:hypothetical protein
MLDIASTENFFPNPEQILQTNIGFFKERKSRFYLQFGFSVQACYEIEKKSGSSLLLVQCFSHAHLTFFDIVSCFLIGQFYNPFVTAIILKSWVAIKRSSFFESVAKSTEFVKSRPGMSIYLIHNRKGYIPTENWSTLDRC